MTLLKHKNDVNLNFTNTNEFSGLMSQSIPTGYIPPPGQPPGISSKNLPRGSGFDFWKLPGTGNSTRTGILWKMKVKLQKNSVDQILQVKTKTSWIFDLFRGLRVLSMEFFLVYGSIIWFCYHTYLTKYLRSCPWLVYIWRFHWVMVIHTYFCTKGCDYVKRFVRVLVLLVINTKICWKWGTLHCRFPVQTMLKSHINVCTRGDLCSSFF